MKSKLWIFLIYLILSVSSVSFAADVRIDALTPLGAEPASDDIYVINDTSTNITKSVTTAYLFQYANITQSGTSTIIGDGGVTDYIEIAADGTITLYGTARKKVKSWVDAGGIRAPGGKPATFVLSGLAGSWSFADQAVEANQETVNGVWTVPTDMEKAEGVSMKINWYANGVSPGNCKWQLEYLWVKANEDETGAAQETLTVVSTASATSNGFMNAEFTGIDVPDDDDNGLFYEIKRLSADAADTIAAATLLRGRSIIYTANKFGQAL